MDTSHLLESVAQEATHGKGAERIREEGTVPLTALAQSLNMGDPQKRWLLGHSSTFRHGGQESHRSTRSLTGHCSVGLPLGDLLFGIVFTTSSLDPQPGPFRSGESQFPLLIESMSGFFGVSLLLPILQTENLDSPCME